VSIEGVENHVDFLSRIFRHDLIHEIEELAPPPSRVMAGFHLARHDIEGSKQRGRSVPLIAVAEAVHGFSVGQSKVALGSLQSLNMRFLINTDNYSFLRRIQIETDHIGCLRAELRVGGDAPTAPPLELDAATSQNPPDMVLTDIPQSLRRKLPVTLRKPSGRRFVEYLQHTVFRVFGVLVRLA
jgi:hypothetical protein